LISFGFWGFLIGPAIVAFVVTLIRVLGRSDTLVNMNKILKN